MFITNGTMVKLLTIKTLRHLLLPLACDLNTEKKIVIQLDNSKMMCKV